MTHSHLCLEWTKGIDRKLNHLQIYSDQLLTRPQDKGLRLNTTITYNIMYGPSLRICLNWSHTKDLSSVCICLCNV